MLIVVTYALGGFCAAHPPYASTVEALNDCRCRPPPLITRMPTSLVSSHPPRQCRPLSLPLTPPTTPDLPRTPVPLSSQSPISSASSITIVRSRNITESPSLINLPRPHACPRTLALALGSPFPSSPSALDSLSSPALYQSSTVIAAFSSPHGHVVWSFRPHRVLVDFCRRFRNLGVHHRAEM